MKKTRDIPSVGPGRPGDICVDFGKSVMRLTAGEWMAVGLSLLACFAWIPAWWERREPLDVSPDGRVAYEFSEDYWTYRRLLKRIVEADRVPVFGDSFVWGEYVPAGQSLPGALNAETASNSFANVGLNGAHPLALCGLVRNDAGEVQNCRVVLHCNLLWMSSPERDLQSDKEVAFNHPRLVSQFFPRIPSYKASFSQRVGIVVDRAIPFFDLVNHVRTRYFDGQDLHSWSIANPYANPLAQLDKQPPESAAESHRAPVRWAKQGIQAQDFPWIDLDASLQWRAWRETAERLRSKGNRVLAIVGPFNEHLLTPASRNRYHDVKRQVEAWLSSHGFCYLAPGLLPSDEFGDASHPLSAGYARLAKEIVAARVFQDWFRSR